MNISSWPYFDEKQIKRVSNVLNSGNVNYWTGEETKSFEREFASWSNNNYAIALANGSLALSAAYLALKIGKGDEVITTPRTFIATSSSICLLKAKPVFADVDLNSGNITAESIEPLITSKTKAISVVHIGGWPADMIEISKLAKIHNLSLIEDCAQAHGGKIKIDDKFKSVGSFSDIAAWSFCQDKIISTGGEGGMVTTSNEYLYKKMWSIKDHGKSYDLSSNKTNSNSFKWLHNNFGSNFRLTEMQSAIGRVQLTLIEDWHKKRTRNANILFKVLKDLTNVRIPMPPKNVIHAWYKFYCYIKKDSLSKDWSRERVIEEIKQENLPAYSGSCSEIYLEKCFQKYSNSYNERLINARSLGNNSLMFLVHPTITANEMEEYALIIKKVLLKAKN